MIIMQFSFYDKKYLISASNMDKNICLWDLTDNNRLVKTMKGNYIYISFDLFIYLFYFIYF